VLYLANLTLRTKINDLNDDVYNYIKDVYFSGETVEAIYNDEWYVALYSQGALPPQSGPIPLLVMDLCAVITHCTVLY